MEIALWLKTLLMKKTNLFLLVLAIGSIAHAQNVGIGTVSPAARLHVSDSAVLFTGPNTVPLSTLFDPPASGIGARTFWYPQKAAFRTGYVEAANWDKDSIGRLSFSAGYNTRATGFAATSFGYGSRASGGQSVSMGLNTEALGPTSTSFGDNTTATGIDATSMGGRTIASGTYATSMGVYSLAEGESSLSLGENSSAIGDRSISGGYFSIARGATSFAMGTQSIARSNNSFVVGQFNDTTAINTLFEVGNGASNVTRKNAVTVLASGFVGIGTITPTQVLHVVGNIFATGTITPSDARYKRNITLINNPIAKLQQLNGVTYNYRNDEFPEMKFPEITQVGLIAQDVEKVFPQLVFTDDKGYKAVDYVKLIPLLIETAKVQEKQQEAIQATIRKQQEEIDALKGMVEKLVKR